MNQGLHAHLTNPEDYRSVSEQYRPPGGIRDFDGAAQDHRDAQRMHSRRCTAGFASQRLSAICLGQRPGPATERSAVHTHTH